MDKFRRNCAGIDIGSRGVFTSLDGDKRIFAHSTFTVDFQELAQLLVDHKIETVAMEATGVYWVILYEILESKGMDVWLVDGRQTKQVPGRKTDVKDCQWIHQLHSYGLLNRCHFTTGDLKKLRVFQRIRENHIKSKAKCINQMQKALIQMNIRITQVLSQIHGVSGLKMIKAILEGERDSEKLLALCDKRIRNKKSTEILKALQGFYRAEHLFELEQAYKGYYFYIDQIKDCDRKMEQHLNDMTKDLPLSEVDSKRKAIRHNKPKIDNLGNKMIQLCKGIDPTVLPGITDYTILQLLAELGDDLSKWPSTKHFTSWLGLSPGQNNSGIRSRNKKKKGNRRAGKVFKQIANNLINSCKKTALGAFGRRLKARKGPLIANKAVARKLAEMFWRLIERGNDYVEIGIKNYEKKITDRKMAIANKIANELNFKLVAVN